MTLRKTIYRNEIVFKIEQNFVDDVLARKIIKNIDNTKNIGIDMQNVQNIDSPVFIEYLSKDKFKLFNLQSEVLAYLALTLKNGSLKSYVNYLDFSNDKRELFKRRFLVA